MQSLVADTRAMLDANLQAEAENSGHAHHVEWSIAPLPIVVGDENMIRQVWLNLLGNAVKYSGNREPARIRVDYQPQPDGGHQFTVSDNGAGFDMAYAGKLFGVFQRLHKASDYPGTGIGLASVRRVLTRHGGRIWAEAEPDVGATFHFTCLPRSTRTNKGLLHDHSAHHSSRRRQPGGCRNGDRCPGRGASGQSHRARRRRRGSDGLPAAPRRLRQSRGRPAVLLDIKMPRMDGLEVLRQIREHEELKRLPVVILSSSREESDLARSWDMGVNAYVVKPVDVDQFFGAVQTLGKFWALINQAPELE